MKSFNLIETTEIYNTRGKLVDIQKDYSKLIGVILSIILTVLFIYFIIVIDHTPTGIIYEVYSGNGVKINEECCETCIEEGYTKGGFYFKRTNKKCKLKKGVFR
jgi:hypothetical protein